MACSLQLPFWPASYDCVKWSIDNHIAILGGESILILSPRLREPLPNGQWWDRSHLIQVNAFTASEVPRPAVLHDRDFSIGEELADHQTVSAEWSSPGLARQKGCALAILTSNHVLSIWAKEGYAGSAKWQRVLVVNQAIRAFYDKIDAVDQTGSLKSEDIERRQVQQRVRTFAWSQPLHTKAERTSRHRFAGTQFLLVSTEGGALLTLRINSPYEDPLGHQNSWTATVTGSLNMPQVGRAALALLSPATNGAKAGQLEVDAAKEAWVANDLILTNWHLQDSEAAHSKSHALLTLIMGGRLFTVCLTGDPVNKGADFGVNPTARWHLREYSDICGPLRHATPDRQCVVAFGLDGVFCCYLRSNLNNGEIDVYSHDLDGRWDDITGAAVSVSSASGQTVLHIVSHLSSATAATAALELPFLGLPAEQPTWQLAIDNAKTAYGDENDIGSNVQERTWGIAGSPCAPYVATCASMHASDIVAYLGHIRQTSLFCITREDGRTRSDGAQENFVLTNTADAETILFWLREYLKHLPYAAQPASDRERLIEYVFEANPKLAEPNDDQSILQKLRVQLYEHADLRRCQATRIVGLAMNGSELDPKQIQTVVSHVNATLSTFSEVDVFHDELCLRIKRIYADAVSMMSTDFQTSYIEPSARDDNEHCQICHQSIPFESLQWARCGQGHQFNRCRLSLLAVQEPGTHKSCGICGLQYLNETALFHTVVDGDREHLPEGEVTMSISANGTHSRGGSTTARSTTSLGALLFAACDVCIYCGGKFTD